MGKTSNQLVVAIKKAGDPVCAKNLARFFKTAPGQYGHGDVFAGVTVPVVRVIAKQFISLGFLDLQKLLESPIHECRFAALEILVMQYERADVSAKKKIVSFYLKNLARVNNWDLVDTSAPYILGDYLLSYDRAVLVRLAKSPNVWKRRVAVVATAAFIAKGEFGDTLAIATMLLGDKHDLIHKAVGWMLREVGKRSPQTLREFLNEHTGEMPRTMLRYAIEKFAPAERKRYLAI